MQPFAVRRMLAIKRLRKRLLLSLRNRNANRSAMRTKELFGAAPRKWPKYDLNGDAQLDWDSDRLRQLIKTGAQLSLSRSLLPLLHPHCCPAARKA